MSYDSDDELEILKPMLPVANGHSDLSRPPADGSDYLQRVRIEAKKYPEFVTADIDLDKSSDDTQVEASFQQEGRFLPAEQSTMTSVEWRQYVVNQFIKVRKKVATGRAKGIFANELKDSLPKFSDLARWKNIIRGTVSSSVEKKSETEESGSSESEDEDCEKKLKLISPVYTGLVPKLSVMLLLPQSLIVDILESLIDLINEEGYSHRLGMWAYSSLACIEEPLQPDYFHIIRRLSRICSFIRSKHDHIQDKSLINSLNVIITLIGIYFNQKDLQDPTVLHRIE